MESKEEKSGTALYTGDIYTAEGLRRDKKTFKECGWSRSEIKEYEKACKQYIRSNKACLRYLGGEL